MQVSDEIKNRVHALQSTWQAYLVDGHFDHFVEFTIAINCLVEHFNRLRLPGLLRVCEGLEKSALDLLGTPDHHPLGLQERVALQRQIDALQGAIASSSVSAQQRRAEDAPNEKSQLDAKWLRLRSVWLIATPEMAVMSATLKQQMDFFGFRTRELRWGADLAQDDAPLAVIFISNPDTDSSQASACIAMARAQCPSSQLIYYGAPHGIENVVELMRAGIDTTIPQEEGASALLSCILDLVQSETATKLRVLVVEDSMVAVKLIQRTLTEHGLESRAIMDPGTLLEELESYRPDLVLMDMHMPRFNGIEATRVLRQMAAYKSLPIIYLSGEADIGMQVEALRLGGDQFLIKPFNPVLLTAVIKTKIDRFRETQRSTQIDGLTGLLNHTAAKSQLKSLVDRVSNGGGLTVAMIDIDHFKSVNDTYGHPVGDQVIRRLAWLLKGHLRSTDLIGRYGGEEFILALTDATPEQAQQVIDHIRKDFAALPHTHATGTLYASFSAGIASWPDYDTATTLTEAADSALLESKRNGRNRVSRA